MRLGAADNAFCRGLEVRADGTCKSSNSGLVHLCQPLAETAMLDP